MNHVWNRRVPCAFVCLIIFVGISMSAITYFEMKVREEMFALSTANVASIASKYGQRFAEILPEDNLSSNMVARFLIRTDLEDKLDLLIADDIQYAFVLFRGEGKEYRYLADGSRGNEKGYYGEKFIPNAEEYDLAYATTVPQILFHDEKIILGLTYIYPILNEKKYTKALLVIDMSVHTVENINALLENVHDALFFMCVILFFVGGIVWYYDEKYISAKTMVNQDPLTKLYNRGILQELNIDPSDYVVVLLDIDFFKWVNDTYGHDLGDYVLKELAHRLHELCREKMDYIIRYGGEEFLLLLKCGKKEEMLQTIERLREGISLKKFYCQNKELDITASFGADLYPQRRESLEESITCADIALYEAKNSGRNRTCVYKEKSVFVSSNKS